MIEDSKTQRKKGTKLYVDLQVQGLKLGVAADRPGDFTAIQMDLNRLEKWAGWNLNTFNREVQSPAPREE